MREIFDILGRQIMKSDVVSENISVQSLNKGTYIILLKDAEGKSYAQKFIKE